MGSQKNLANGGVGSGKWAETVIGLVGGESTAYINGGYDKGTKGAHLHYVVVEGFHVNDFSSYTLNPRYFNTYPGILNGYFRRKKAWQNKKMSILYTTNKGRIWYTLLLWVFG